MTINSPTDIANLTLDLLSANSVQDIENPTNATEEICNRWYDMVRKKVLRKHPWNFAAKRAILAASSTDPEFGYSKQFPLPNDFVRLLWIETSDGGQISAQDYDLENGSILVNTDGDSLNLVYVYDITDVTRFDAMFTDLFIHEYALALAYKVTGNNADVDRLNRLSEKIEAMSKAVDGQERPPRRREISRNVSARNYGRNSNASHRIIF